MHPKRPLADRFWEKVEKTDSCWLWAGAKSRTGYGHLTTGGAHGQTVEAHRVAWTLAHGFIPEGLWVLHKCDVRLCVNPNHLFLGTQMDNTRDAQAKNRIANAFRLPHTRLSDEQASEIRRRYITIRELADEYGVTSGAIWGVIKQKSHRSPP